MKVVEMTQVAAVEMLAGLLIRSLVVGVTMLVVVMMLTHLQVEMTQEEMLVVQMPTHSQVEMMQGVLMQAETQTHLQVEGTMQVEEQTMLEQMQELTMQEPLKESLLLTMP